MKMLRNLRKEGRLILVFPSGTRYRPWDPSTARGLKEIDTYLKFYSYMVLVSINGNTLVPNPRAGMDEDYPVEDLMIYTVSPVRRCSEFRRQALKGRDHDEDPKQHVADNVMAALRGLHDRTEKSRLQLLAELGRTANPVRVRPPGRRGPWGIPPAARPPPCRLARPGLPAPVRTFPRPSAGISPGSSPTSTTPSPRTE